MHISNYDRTHLYDNIDILSHERKNCKALINGKVISYDIALTLSFANDKILKEHAQSFDFIGEGIIYTINDILQNDNQLCNFYTYKGADHV